MLMLYLNFGVIKSPRWDLHSNTFKVKKTRYITMLIMTIGCHPFGSSHCRTAVRGTHAGRGIRGIGAARAALTSSFSLALSVLLFGPECQDEIKARVIHAPLPFNERSHR